VTVLKQNIVLLAHNISFFAASWVVNQELKIYIDEEDNRHPPYDTAVMKRQFLNF
jgi:hypothetical protein